jgi:hypothetical protein
MKRRSSNDAQACIVPPKLAMPYRYHSPPNFIILTIIAFVLPSIMGRGFGWTFTEKVLLSQAYIQATNDPIKGADQKSATFKRTIFENFVRLAEAGGHDDPNRFKGKCSEFAFVISNSALPFSRHLFFRPTIVCCSQGCQRML